MVEISALANLTGTARQLQFHLGAAMNAGLGEAQMNDSVSALEFRLGKGKAGIA